MKNKNRIPLELYIHIPFCVQKCQYCDFLSGPSDQETRDRYIKALRAEIQAVQGVEAYEIVSVFIGGDSFRTESRSDCFYYGDNSKEILFLAGCRNNNRIKSWHS